MTTQRQSDQRSFSMKWIGRGGVSLLIPLAALWLLHPAQAADMTPEQIYAASAPAVVLVAGASGSQRMLGAGSIIRADGLVLTNAHVVIDHDTGSPHQQVWIFLKPDRLTGDFDTDLKQRFEASVHAFDRDLDLALVKIMQPPSPLPVLNLGDSDAVNIGAKVVAIGHPEMGGLWSLTTGVISAHLANFGEVSGRHVFQTEASMNRGNSGGPLINGDGHQVGVNTSVARMAEDGFTITDVNFSLKSNVARNWLAKEGVTVKYAQVASMPEGLTPPTESIPSLEEAKGSGKQQGAGVAGPGKSGKIEQGEKSAGLPPPRPYNLDQLAGGLDLAERDLESLAEEMRGKIRAKREREAQESGGRSSDMTMRHPGTSSATARVQPSVPVTRPTPRTPEVARVGEPPEEQLDCTVYETKSVHLSLGFKFGNFLLNVGPEVGFSHRSGVAWNKVVHGTIARYVELCNRYNAGMVNKAEYEARLHEIERLYKEAQELEAKLFDATRQRSRSASSELDRELGRLHSTMSPNQTELEESVEGLARRIEQLQPIGRPLKPKKPCPLPDMLGAPGAKPDPDQKC